MDIEYRVLETIAELEQAVDVEVVVWGLDQRFAAPSNLMRAVSHDDGGGVVIGAFDGSAMIGMSFGLPVRRRGQWVLWSHMTGVAPDYQNRGIGFGLKQAQRAWALDFGYEIIGWTFDPLQRGNANFNLHYLGTVARDFHTNLYGEMTDEINRGLDSDRMEATWILRDERVARLAAGEPVAPVTDHFPDAAFLVRSEDGRPVMNPMPPLNARWYFVEIPYNIGQVKKSGIDLARQWQLALRQALPQAFARGRSAVDFVVFGERCWYVLQGGP